MRAYALFVLLVLLSSASAKYEDQFGKVYDWKKEGFAQPIDAAVSQNGAFLVTKTGLAVVDGLGTFCSSRKV